MIKIELVIASKKIIKKPKFDQNSQGELLKIKEKLKNIPKSIKELEINKGSQWSKGKTLPLNTLNQGDEEEEIQTWYHKRYTPDKRKQLLEKCYRRFDSYRREKNQYRIR